MAQAPTVIGLSDEMTKISRKAKAEGKRVGFVPTMGALHEGHLSLVKAARQQCDLVVVSIFVNPTQFNDPKDFERYPRTVNADVELLANNGCDYIFVPESVAQIYPEGYSPFTLDLGLIADVMEGKHRPGHFNGVLNVVYQLFSIVEPSKAFFGLKDYQQYLVIRELIRQKQLPIELIGMPTSRTDSGLARSSRNKLLSEEEREIALQIYQSLQQARGAFGTKTVAEIEQDALQFYAERSDFTLEYFEIADGDTLAPLSGNGEASKNPMAFIATKLGNIRLIDNLFLKN